MSCPPSVDVTLSVVLEGDPACINIDSLPANCEILVDKGDIVKFTNNTGQQVKVTVPCSNFADPSTSQTVDNGDSCCVTVIGTAEDAPCDIVLESTAVNGPDECTCTGPGDTPKMKVRRSAEDVPGLHDALKAKLQEIEDDVHKFSAKKNKAAGTRIRKAMQEVKKLAQAMRKEVQETRSKW